MERDFNKEVSSSDDSSDKNAEDEKTSDIEEKRLLLAKLQNIQKQNEKKEKELHETMKEFKKYLSKDTFENFPDSTNLLGSFGQPNTDSYDYNEALAKQCEDISTRIRSLKEDIDNLVCVSNSPSKASNREIQASGSYSESDTAYKTPLDSEIIEKNVESDSYVGKGKIAKDKRYRYKKRSKPNVSSCESLTKDSPVKCSEEASNTQESKSVDPQPLKDEKTRISSALKRKGSDSKESDLDESCAGTSATSNLSGNREDEDNDLKIAKKLKLEDDEKISRQNPTLTGLLSQKDYESIDLAQFMEQPQTDQIYSNREQLILPSTSGLSYVVGCISNSEESSLTSVSDMSPSERGESPLTNASEDTFLSGDDE